MTAYPSPRSFELAAGQKAVEMQSRRNWRRFGPVLVSDPHDEAELEAVPKLIRMAFIVGSVVPRGLSAPRRADGGGRFGRRLCPDASSGLAHPTGTAPILFWLGSSHTTGRLCPYSCRGDGGNRRLTNEVTKITRLDFMKPLLFPPGTSSEPPPLYIYLYICVCRIYYANSYALSMLLVLVSKHYGVAAFYTHAE